MSPESDKIENGGRPSFAEDQNEEKSVLNYISEDLLESLIDNPFESLILVDADGIVRFVNNSYEKAYGRKLKNAIGRYVLDVAPESRLPEVLETGKVIVDRSRVLEDKSQIVIRLPLRKQGKLTGALGKVIFAPPETLQDLARKIKSLEQHLAFYKEALKSTYSSRYTFEDIIGETEGMRNAKALARQSAVTDVAVLILGESGSGKELFAHAIHSASPRREKAFVSVNCTAIPNELIESELFGYDPGAFTGSLRKGKKGKFELSDKGTIHLDEIGDMPYLMQSKLLRVLEEGEIEKVGGTVPQQVDFRLICTTNRPLEEMVKKGTFRLDLFYRINVIAIEVPPLRDICDDIPLIVQHFLRNLRGAKALQAESISDQALDTLMRYSWPGNVRELKNVVERAIALCRGSVIEIDDLPSSLMQGTVAEARKDRVPPLKETTCAAERQAILKALQATENNKSAAAKLLEIHRTALYQKMVKHGIPV